MLTGIRVLDLSRLLPGPACTWFLQGMGATVDRVEPPGVGDLTRHVPPMVDGVGAVFATYGRGKRSLALDLRHREAPAVLRTLAARYDVLVEGFKPGVMEALGLGPEVIEAELPRLIVARLSGFGQTGPWSTRPGHDINYVGLTGVISGASRTEGRPDLMAAQVADLSGAMVAAMGIAAALFDRERTGRGRILDVSLTEAAMAVGAHTVTTHTASGRPPLPAGEMLTGGLPSYGVYACADGRFLTVGALEPKFQAMLQTELGTLTRPGLAAVFATRPRDEWVALLADACVGPALLPSELADHPQHAARGAIARVGATSFVLPPLRDASTATGALPGLGEHTDAILDEAGLDPAALRASGVVA